MVFISNRMILSTYIEKSRKIGMNLLCVTYHTIMHSLFRISNVKRRRFIVIIETELLGPSG